MNSCSPPNCSDGTSHSSCTAVAGEYGLCRHHWRSDRSLWRERTHAVKFTREQAETIIARLELESLPVEPILFRQLWKKTEGNEVLGTVMLGAMLAESFSVMHRLTADETWMGGRLAADGVFALFGNTMTPGFTSERFEGGDRAELCNAWPDACAMITALTHDETVRIMPEGY